MQNQIVDEQMDGQSMFLTVAFRDKQRNFSIDNSFV